MNIDPTVQRPPVGGNDSIPRYIGVTDFRDSVEVRSMLSVFEGSDPAWKLMVGMMASPKSLAGLPHKYERVWLPPSEIRKVFLDDPRAFNVPHWADYDGVTTVDQLEELMGLCGPNAHALQLDMPWPDPDLVVGLRKSFDVPVILQVGRRAINGLDVSKGKAPALIDRLDGYGTSISGVLLDRSGGEGKALDPAYLEWYVEAVSQHRPDLTVAVAGGLGPKSMSLIVPLLAKFPWLSWDAQSQLRVSGKSTDPIEDWIRVSSYIADSLDLCRRYAGTAA